MLKFRAFPLVIENMWRAGCAESPALHLKQALLVALDIIRESDMLNHGIPPKDILNPTLLYNTKR